MSNCILTGPALITANLLADAAESMQAGDLERAERAICEAAEHWLPQLDDASHFPLARILEALALMGMSRQLEQLGRERLIVEQARRRGVVEQLPLADVAANLIE